MGSPHPPSFPEEEAEHWGQGAGGFHPQTPEGESPDPRERARGGRKRDAIALPLPLGRSKE